MTLSGLNSIDAVLDVLYLAPTTDAGWGVALSALANRFKSAWSGLISAEMDVGQPSSESAFRLPQFRVYWGIPEDALRLYGSYYAARDPWYLALKSRQISSWTGKGTQLCSARKFEKTEFFNEFYKTGRYPAFFQLGAMVHVECGSHAVLTLLREKGLGDFSATEVRCLRELTPHLRRSIEIEGRISAFRRTAQGAADALDSLDIAFITLDRLGRCQCLNPSAESMIRSGTFFRLRDNQLVASDPQDFAALRALIDSAVGKSWSKSPLGGYLTLHSDSRCLYVSVLPIQDRALSLPGHGCVLITAFSPDSCPQTRERALATLFRLTAAEIRVAALLLHGLKPKEIASQTSTTYETVRFQLKSIFQKTNTTRQSQLLRLISRLPGASPFLNS